jgi:hypothetical protein
MRHDERTPKAVEGDILGAALSIVSSSSAAHDGGKSGAVGARRLQPNAADSKCATTIERPLMNPI